MYKYQYHLLQLWKLLYIKYVIGCPLRLSPSLIWTGPLVSLLLWAYNTKIISKNSYHQSQLILIFSKIWHFFHFVARYSEIRRQNVGNKLLNRNLFLYTYIFFIIRLYPNLHPNFHKIPSFHVISLVPHISKRLKIFFSFSFIIWELLLWIFYFYDPKFWQYLKFFHSYKN